MFNGAKLGGADGAPLFLPSTGNFALEQYTYGIYFCSKIPKNPCLALALFTPLCAYDYVIPNIFWEPEAIFDVMCGYGDCCKLCTSYQSSKQTWFNSKFIAHFWLEKLNFLSDILKKLITIPLGQSTFQSDFEFLKIALLICYISQLFVYKIHIRTQLCTSSRYKNVRPSYMFVLISHLFQTIVFFSKPAVC